MQLEFNNHWMQLPPPTHHGIDNEQASLESSMMQHASVMIGPNSKRQSPRPSVQAHAE